MKKITVLQIITLLAIIAFLVYELYFVRNWIKTQPESGAIIRVDLVLFLPILAILTGISIYQFFKKQ
jgi:hypothetical protein